MDLASRQGACYKRGRDTASTNGIPATPIDAFVGGGPTLAKMRQSQDARRGDKIAALLVLFQL
jgi:hypothetical protein